MKGKIFVSSAEEFEQKTEEFFQQNKNMDIKFITTGMGFGGEAVMVTIFYEEKDQTEKASRVDFIKMPQGLDI